ncbi:MAG: glycoside hydrolase family 3 C-terminal domain-containing protein, partial [Capsulimonadaceae bacterium]
SLRRGLLAESVMSAPVASLRRGLLAEGGKSAPVASLRRGLLAESVMSAPVASLRRGLLAEGVMSAPVASLRRGLRGEYFVSADQSGKPAATSLDSQLAFGPEFHEPDSVKGTIHSARWTGFLTAPAAGHYRIDVTANSGVRLTVRGKTIIDQPTLISSMHSGEIDLPAGECPIRVDLLSDGDDGHIRVRMGWVEPDPAFIQAAAQAAAASDVAVVFVDTGGEDGEGHDRPSTLLHGNQDAMIRAVAAANKHTIVVLNAGSPVDVTGWQERVPALIDAGYPGMEGGRAIADILFGKVNPSGKLTDTFGAHRKDYPDYGNFPGINGTVHYAEGIYVGYRYFDKHNITPVFPFGYGLSYTTFQYSRITVPDAALAPDGAVTVTVPVTNTGKRDGAEVVELYVHPLHPAVDRPIRELKGFARVDLKAGQTMPVTFPITPQALAYYDTAGNRWKADPGDYAIDIGASSRDIRQTTTIRLTGTYTAPP